MDALTAVVVLVGLGLLAALAAGAYVLGASGGKVEAAEKAAEDERRTKEWLANRPTVVRPVAPDPESWT